MFIDRLCCRGSFVVQVVEILFARGLVKVLFATETFAMVRGVPTAQNLSWSLTACLHRG